MPTYAQLALEPAWNAEDAPPNLDEFYRLLRVFYNLPASHIGGKGDNNHLRGYHRSRRWINESQYSKFGKQDYSIQYELDQGGDDNWLSALDMTVPAQKLYAACRRLDAAVRAGQIPQLREWYGSFDGVTVVGYDTAKDRPATSDSSHLWHLHISFYRSRADWDHTLLYQTITGIGDGMAINDRVLLAPGNPDTADNKELQATLHARGHDLGTSGPDGNGVDGSYGNRTTTAVKAEQAAAGYPETGSLDVKLWRVLDAAPDPGPDPEPEPGEPVDYDRIRTIVREELDATQVTVDLQPGE